MGPSSTSPVKSLCCKGGRGAKFKASSCQAELRSLTLSNQQHGRTSRHLPGEVESKAASRDFGYGSSHPVHAECHPVVEASSQSHGSDKMHDDNPTTKPTSQEITEVANHIYSTAKAVLEQSHHEFLQLLTSMDRNNPGSDCGSPQQSGASSSEAKPQWKRKVNPKKSAASMASSPLSPGLVTRTSSIYVKQEKLQEKRYENLDEDPMKTDKTKLSIMGLKDMDKVKEVASKARSIASSVSSEDSKATSPKDSGRVRIRITPQHFSPLGTTFRDVHVDFLSMNFAMQAVDCEGYVWTARSNTMPGYLAVDRCKYKIDPNGKDVLITLCAMDEDQSLKGLARLELIRPYKFEEKSGDSKNNFI